MAISEFEIKRCVRELQKFLVTRRPPKHIRHQLDFGYRIDNQSVELYEIRPHWRKPEIINHHNFAKATYVKSKQHWKIFWLRQDLKWHKYGPVPTVKYIEEFLQVVDEDEFGCFFG